MKTEKNWNKNKNVEQGKPMSSQVIRENQKTEGRFLILSVNQPVS